MYIYIYIYTLPLDRTISSPAALHALAAALPRVSALSQLSISCCEPRPCTSSAWGTCGSLASEVEAHQNFRVATNLHRQDQCRRACMEGLLHLAIALTHVLLLQRLEFNFQFKTSTLSKKAHSPDAHAYAATRTQGSRPRQPEASQPSRRPLTGLLELRAPDGFCRGS